jgi:hypothetical protein
MTPVTPTTLTLSSGGTYETVALTTYFGSDAGNVAGVILHVYNTANSDISCHARKYGSTDSYSRDSYHSHHQQWCGVDSQDRIEIYRSNTAIAVQLVGYYLNSEAVFFTNSVDKSAVAIGWTDVDCSADIGSDTAVAGIFLMSNNGLIGNQDGGMRISGSSANYSTGMYQNSPYPGCQSFVIGLTAGGICQQYVSNTTVGLYMLGYLKNGFTSYDHISKLAGVANWATVDCSADVSADANGGYFYFEADTTSLAWGVRNADETGAATPLDEWYGPGVVWCSFNANKQVEAYLESATQTMTLVGASSAGIWTPKITIIN